MIVVNVVELPPSVLRPGTRYTIEMRVDQAGVIVFRSGAVSCVNMLERRQNERGQQPQACL